MPNPKPYTIPPPNAHAPAWEWIGLAAIAAVFLYLAWLFFVPAYYGGIDEASYMVQAKTLARTGQPILHINEPLAFVPENMVERAPGEFVAKYPAGYPLLAAIGYWLAGPAGAFYVNPIMALATIAGFYVLARRWLPTSLALAGTATLALHPMILWHATGALSHIAETALCVWGFVLATRWSKTGGMFTAAAATVLLGYACAVRYTAALMVLPLGVLVLQRAVRLPRDEKPRLTRDLLAMAVGAILALTPLLLYQYAAFGSPFSTGYGLTNESRAFSADWFIHHAWTAIVTLNRPGYGLVLLFPLALLWLASGWRKDRPRTLFLAAWILPPLLLYMAYYWVPPVTNSAQYVRFFLQLFPPIVLAALLLIERFTRGKTVARNAAAVLLCVLAITTFAASGARDVLEQSLATGRYAEEAALLVNRNAPAGAIVLTDAVMGYFLLFATDDEIYDLNYFDAAWVARRQGDLQAPGIHVFNRLRAQRFFNALGNVSQENLDAQCARLLTRKASTPAGAYLVTNDQRVRYWQARLGQTFDLVAINVSPYHQVLLKVQTRSPNPSPSK